MRSSRIQLKKKDVAKRGDPRSIPFSAAFSAWLALIPSAERVGKIVDRRGRRNRLDKLHAHAGVAKKANGPRHTFASHDLVAYNDPAATRKKIGHDKDSDVLFKHYISEVTEEQAAEFQALRPPTDVVVEAPGDWRRKPRGPRVEGGGGPGMSAKVVDFTLNHTPPAPATRWTARGLAAAVGSNHNYVLTVWKREGITPSAA